MLCRDAVLTLAVSADLSGFDRALVRNRTKSCGCLDLGDHQSSQTVRRRYVEVETSMYYTAVVRRGVELCRRRLDMVRVAASNTERCPRRRGMAEEQRSWMRQVEAGMNACSLALEVDNCNAVPDRSRCEEAEVRQAY